MGHLAVMLRYVPFTFPTQIANMADVINVNDLRYLSSVNTPDYPPPTWKSNPDMSAVAGVEHRYWVWDAIGDRPVEMDQDSKDEVDAAIVTATLDHEILKVDNTKEIIRAMSLLLVSHINGHVDNLNEMRAAAANSTDFGEFKTAMSNMATHPTWTIALFRAELRYYLGT